MCGIAGFFQYNSSLESCHQPDAVLRSMLDAIYHRGPDDEGTLVEPPAWLGMRRLSIISLDDGKQPIYDESGRFGVLFNGEIYNYRELRESLQSRGHILKTNSDTEVIVHLFEEYGRGCLEHLRGMFAFVIWDSHKRELFVARDRLGIKPLYYANVDGQFIFASELKAIVRHPNVKKELDPVALGDYLSIKYVPAPRTMFRDIQSLEPGHCLTVGQQGIRHECYWDFSIEPDESKSDEECVDQLLDILRESVKLRLRSDVPFGAFLSGGLDSSTIVALMAEQLTSPVETFSVGFESAGVQDELPFAEQVAKHFGCKHHVLKIGAKDFLQYAEDVIYHLDQPIADQATVATFMLSRLAGQSVKMVLTGEGGDELFAGYARYEGERMSPAFGLLPDWGKAAFRSFSGRLPGLRRAKIAAEALSYGDEAQRYAAWFPMFTQDMRKRVLSSYMAEQVKDVSRVFRKQLRRCGEGSRLSRMLYCDTKLWLPDYLLLRGDKLTMAHSIEGRVPLLDHKLVEFAARLPDRMKLRSRQRKWLLKQAASRLLPKDIIERKKQGFPIPIEKWLKDEAKDLVHDCLSEEVVRRRGLFSPQYVRELVKAHESGYADRATEIWGLVSLEIWSRRFLDQAEPSVAPKPINDELRGLKI